MQWCVNATTLGTWRGDLFCMSGRPLLKINERTVEPYNIRMNCCTHKDFKWIQTYRSSTINQLINLANYCGASAVSALQGASAPVAPAVPTPLCAATTHNRPPEGAADCRVFVKRQAAMRKWEPNSTTRTPATNITNEHHQRTKNCHIPTSWHVEMLGSGIAMWQICCRIVVSLSVGGVRSRCL